MMKIFSKNSVLRLAVIAASFGLLSCEDSSDPQQIWISSATPNIVDGYPTEIITDSGRTLTVIENNSGMPLSNTQRIFAQYQILDGSSSNNFYDINLLGVRNILTKDIVTLTPENELELGNDPVEPYDVWFASGYLSVNFGFYYGGTASHFINMVQSTVNPNPTDGKVYLEFRHNSYGDPMVLPQYGTVSFNVEQFMTTPGQDVTFVISFNELLGEQSYEFTYNYLEPTSITQSIATEKINLDGYN